MDIIKLHRRTMLTTTIIQTMGDDESGFRTAYLMFMKEKCSVRRTRVSAEFSREIFW